MTFTTLGFVVVLIYGLCKVIYLLTPKGRREAAARSAADAEKKARSDREVSEANLRAKAHKERSEATRIALRDAEVQDQPYVYEIGRHGNEALAIRYGIANQESKTEEYWYFAKGGVRTRNPARDKIHLVPSERIRLRKLARLDPSQYLVALSDHRDREAIAMIELGTEYVKTFYPLDKRWFDENARLELTLKGNGTFDLKELARFHVEQAVEARSPRKGR